MFGTFEAERDDEPVVYGLVTPIETYDPIKIQSKYYLNIFKFLVNSKYTLRQKFEFMFYRWEWPIFINLEHENNCAALWRHHYNRF